MECKNRLFVARKPMYITSNKFLSDLKKKYGIKKMGFSGTLDPFACGSIIIASGQYTKLFRFLDKTPKVYLTTLMLGASSATLDIEKIEKITPVNPFNEEEIKKTLKTFVGKQKQIPPKYSAKKINGKRAYELARENKKIELKEIEIEIFDIEFINYSHPFITFRASVSEGTFIRTLGEDIAKKLGCDGTLTYLEREKEGKFTYECEKALNPAEYLKIPQNHYKKDKNDLILGKKLDIKDFEIQKPGVYYVLYDKYMAIIEINEKVKYLLNRIELCL